MDVWERQVCLGGMSGLPPDAWQSVGIADEKNDAATRRSLALAIVHVAVAQNSTAGVTQVLVTVLVVGSIYQGAILVPVL